MIQQAFGWAQGFAVTILVGVVLYVGAMRMILHKGVRDGYLLANDAERIAERNATVLGLILGPYLIIAIIAVLHPPFGRWFMNSLLNTSMKWQTSAIDWIDMRVKDDLSATILGALIRAWQFLLGISLAIVGVGMRWTLKRALGVRHFEHLREESIRQDERVAFLAELRQKGQYVEALPAPQRPGGRWPASGSLQDRIRRDVPDGQA